MYVRCNPLVNKVIDCRTPGGGGGKRDPGTAPCGEHCRFGRGREEKGPAV